MRLLFLFFLWIPFGATLAQTTLNAYAKVTSVTGSSVLALSNVNIANHTFTVGGQVVVMQMQDDAIGSNTTNVSGFGNLSAIGNAGRYEIRTIAAVTPTSGTPTSVTLAAVLANTYNTGANSSVQLITFRDLGANYTTTANISGIDWNGNVGGVVAFYVTNTLTLNHRVLADGLGFIGGAMSSSADEACDNTVYITSSNLKAFKGEGIYKSTNANFTNGRGKILNGGGGGAQNNTGGGGGGNYTAGGDGGLGWTCTSANSGYGIGGLSLSAQISASRIFIGGGGGGGQQNNGVGSAGGDGGGIILIKATTFSTSTTCGSSIMLSANGFTAADSGNDGAGGGGAGGSIVIQANVFSINAACPLTVRANAGNGGSVGNSGSHGGGGGGGQGAVIYSLTQPTVNVTTQTNIGTGGANNNTVGAPTASPGAGTSGSGIIAGATGPLPIELLSFTAQSQNTRVMLSWSTASERNNAYFSIEKSSDGINYTVISTIKGVGNSTSLKSYQSYDNQAPEGITYYRLKQTDFDGTYKYSASVSLDADEPLEFSFFPNPVKSGDPFFFKLKRGLDLPQAEVTITDLNGKILLHETLLSDHKNEFTWKNIPLKEGVYLLKVESAGSNKVQKLLVQ